jgi:hypothetical protein
MLLVLLETYCLPCISTPVLCAPITCELLIIPHRPTCKVGLGLFPTMISNLTYMISTWRICLLFEARWIILPLCVLVISWYLLWYICKNNIKMLLKELQERIRFRTVIHGGKTYSWYIGQLVLFARNSTSNFSPFAQHRYWRRPVYGIGYFWHGLGSTFNSK